MWVHPDGRTRPTVDDKAMSLRDAPRPGPIIVGVERSERSRDALALARTLASAAGTRLILVAVYARDARSLSMERGAHAKTLLDEAWATLEWVAHPLNGARAELRTVPCVSVSRGLRQVALDEGALAIVVGPSHRGTSGQVVAGSVAARLLHGAPCPVAVAPNGYAGGTQAALRRIGVGYDDTPEAREALSAAVGLATRTGAKVEVLSVDEPVVPTAMMLLELGNSEQEARVRAKLAETLQRVIDGAPAPIEISGDVVDGYADDELARLSGEVDLLICGSRAHGPLGAVLLGSVSAGVLRKARGPVLVVPRRARDGFAELRPHTEAAA
jgi:nucleotide-binding universal stress UspA family protein